MDYTELRGKTQDEIFAAVAQDSGFPEQILRNMWRTESGEGTNMVSRAGAVGHMQIMPKPLKVMRQTYGEDLDPMNFADSVFMAGKMLKENLQHFGNIPDALSAYNGGWDRSRWDNDETRAYTPKLLAGTNIAYEQPFAVSREQIDTQRAANPQPVQGTPKLNDIEKNAIEQMMLQRSLEGQSSDETVQLATELAQNPQAAFGLADKISVAPPETTYDNANAILKEDAQTDVQTAERIDGRTLWDTTAAAFQQYALTTGVTQSILEYSAELADKRSQIDRAWQQEYEAKRGEMIKGLSPWAVMQMDKAINPQEALDIAAQDKRDQLNQQILNDSSHPILWGITAGMLDPAGWAVGAGAGKAFTVGKGMSTAMRISRITAGNVAGNVAITGAMEALGHQTTPEDYFHAAAFGMVTGVSLGALSRGDRAALAATAQEMHEVGVTRTETFVRQAADELGPQAPAAEVAKRANQMSHDDVMNVADQVFTAPEARSKVFQPEDISPVEQGRLSEEMGLDTVTDEDRLHSISSLYKSSENFLAANKTIIRSAAIAEQKHRGISDTLGWRSAGNELITDDNPLAKTLGMTVAEDAGGISGWRGITVAVKSKLLNNSLKDGIERGLHENYTLWLKDKGVGKVRGAVETYTTGKYVNQFYVQVAKEIRNRADPMFKSSAPRSVQQAADVLEAGFQRMGNIQKKAGTLGNELIPDSSRGYLPQHLNGKAFLALSKNERRQVQQEFIRQAREDFGWDTEFATKKVSEYMNRAEDNVYGLGGGSYLAGSKDLMAVLMEDLYDSTLTVAQRMQILGRLQAGAAKHTHKRLDWDLNATITRDDGSVMPISELYDNNILSLYNGYANRVAGDVAFAHVGIFGERDIRLISEALQRGQVGDSSRTIPAWQQVVNEVYMRPTAVDAGGNLSTTARFIRQYTGVRLLGGVGFAQMAEISNAVSHLGVAHTLNMAARVPKVFSDLKLLKAGVVPENPILNSLDMVAGSPLGAEQYQMVMPQVIDEGLSIVDQRSFNNVMRVMGGAQLLHNKFSFMRAVSSMEQRLVGEEIVRKAFRFMKSGQEDVALREMGFTPELQAKIMAEMDNIAKFDDRGYLQALNVMQMQDKAALMELVTTVRRGTGQIIQETFPGETGKWMRSEIGQLLMQFRKFPSVAIEKQMYRQFGKFGFTRALGGVVTAMGLGTILYYGRAGLAASLMDEDAREEYLKQRLSPAAVANGAIMYVSALGMTNDFLQLGTGVGNLLNDSLDLGWSNSRGVSSQGIGGVIPSLGTLGDVYNYTQRPSNEAALKLLPFTNLPMVLPAINALKHADDDND